MAGQSSVSNTHDTFDIDIFTLSTHTNEKTGDHQHFLLQLTDTITASGETSLHETQFDNGHTFNDVIHVFPVPELPDLREIIHFNNHAADHSLQENTNTLLDAVQQPQADLANLQQAAADTVSTHDVGLQPDLHAANVQASAFHLV